MTICQAVGIDDWKSIADRSTLAQPEAITRANSPAERDRSTELDTFSQQILDWFNALGFQCEGSLRHEGNYVEAIIRIPVRLRFEIVLIHVITHEIGLSDLDSLRTAVETRQVDSGSLVTKSWVSKIVKDTLDESGDRRLTCLTFDELIDRDANFTPYLEWLEREISKREIDRYYKVILTRHGQRVRERLKSRVVIPSRPAQTRIKSVVMNMAITSGALR